MQIRLQKIISAAGIASRRAAEEYITQGRVMVNGTTVTELGSKADPDVDEIKVDGRRLKTNRRPRYILLYKPKGYITTRSDPQRRPTVIDLLSKGGVREYVGGYDDWLRQLPTLARRAGRADRDDFATAVRCGA